VRDVLDVARAWRDQDPDEETRAELEALISDASAGVESALAELHDRFDTRLAFGTAGLRGRIEAGSNRMNRVLVSQAAAGFAAFLRSREQHPSVVIGYDGRKNSHVFATDSARIMAGAGVRVILLPRPLPTPVLAFAVRHLDTSAGIMVTASHNPPADNGYKVYLGGADRGSQIVPPVDGEIADRILEVAATATVLELPRSDDFEMAGEEVLDEYVRRTASLVSGTPSTLRYVYTAMHGVGWETARRVFLEAGFAEPIPVAAQIEPDATFPTVAFPNPEEPGAMDLAFATAVESEAELVIANDPDADRLAIGIPDADGSWERLTGNEVGALLGWRAAKQLAEASQDGTLAASIVSSPALARVAKEYNLSYVDTLTGFKWVSRVAGLSYGYEEALGYLVDPGKVRDKDGISAAVDFIALVAELKTAGKTLLDHRADFAARFGAFESAQISTRVTDLGDIPVMMNRLRSHPPTAIGGVAVRQIDDFTDGFAGLPAGDILRIWLEDGSRVIVRPSGTEPKVKTYIDASSDVGTAAERRSHARAAVDRLAAGVAEFVY
jgi:phosphomannomutase